MCEVKVAGDYNNSISGKDVREMADGKTTGKFL